MNIHEAAEMLNGSEYSEEGSRELFSAMKEAGLVAVYGASDDLMEFNGAIRDEVGCFDGGTAYLGATGLLQNECQDEDCPHFSRACEAAPKIKAIWAPDNGLSWVFETDIPHATFMVFEDDEPYCEGIVFSLKDAA